MMYYTNPGTSICVSLLRVLENGGESEYYNRELTQMLILVDCNKEYLNSINTFKWLPKI